MRQPRTVREQHVVSVMIALYCRHHHSPAPSQAADGGLCPACQALRDYAVTRLARCRYGERKPTCRRCPTHCYGPAMRAQIRRVMRWAGPRMLWYAPLDTLRHWMRR